MVSLTFIVWINNFEMQDIQLRRIDNPWAYCQLADLPQLPSCICKLYKSAPTGPMFLSSLLSYETCRFGVGLGNSAASQNVSSCLWHFRGFDKHMRTMVACRESVNLYQFVLSWLTKSGAHASKVRLSHGWAVPAAKQYTNRKKRGSSSSWTPRRSKDAVQKWSQRSASWVYYIVARSTQTGHLPSGCNWFLSIKQPITSSKRKVLGHVMVFFWDGLSKAWLQWYYIVISVLEAYSSAPGLPILDDLPLIFKLPTTAVLVKSHMGVINPQQLRLQLSCAEIVNETNTLLARDWLHCWRFLHAAAPESGAVAHFLSNKLFLFCDKDDLMMHRTINPAVD